jgi:hypothetical protein
MAATAVALGRIAKAVRAHGEAFAGFWTNMGGDNQTIMAPLDELLAEIHAADPAKYGETEFVLESDLQKPVDGLTEAHR